MSLRRVNRILESFGLTKIEIEVYIFLAKKGPRTMGDVESGLNLTPSIISQSLHRLMKKGFIYNTIEPQSKFHAYDFEQIIDQNISQKRKQVQTTNEKTNEINNQWEAFKNERKEN